MSEEKHLREEQESEHSLDFSEDTIRLLRELLDSQTDPLVSKGRDQGYITPDDILGAISEPDADGEVFFQVVAVFRLAGVEVSEEPSDSKGPEPALAIIIPEDEIDTDDPVRMYLKEIGKVL